MQVSTQNIDCFWRQKMTYWFARLLRKLAFALVRLYRCSPFRRSFHQLFHLHTQDQEERAVCFLQLGQQAHCKLLFRENANIRLGWKVCLTDPSPEATCNARVRRICILSTCQGLKKGRSTANTESTSGLCSARAARGHHGINCEPSDQNA